MPPGFVFYKSFYDALQHLPDEDRGVVAVAILDYAFSGIEPTLSGVLAGYFDLMRPNIDKAIQRYEARVANGKRGGRGNKKS